MGAKGARVASDAAFRSLRHSAAYDRATKAKGFVGYYENVFDDSKRKAVGASGDADGLHGDTRRAVMRRRGAALDNPSARTIDPITFRGCAQPLCRPRALGFTREALS